MLGERRSRISTNSETRPFWELMASGQIIMRKVDGWETLAEPLSDQPIDLAA